MSRTIRRRRDTRALSEDVLWYLGAWGPSRHRDAEPRWIDHADRLRLPPDACDARVAKAVAARFHMDERPGRRNAPAWFRRMLNRHHRAGLRAALRRAVAAGSDDVVDPARRSANWEWF